MTLPKEPVPALSAPGIGAANSLLKPPISGPRSNRRQRHRPYSHVHLEVDLTRVPPDPTGEPLLERFAGLLRERKITERGTLVMLAASALHGLASQRFRRVDHWEVSPGGWLPPPRAGKGTEEEEPVGYLLDALQSGAWTSVESARSFSARLSDHSGNRIDLMVRRVHRERRHSLSLDLWGSWTQETVKDLEGALARRLAIERSEITKFQYA
jgi:hypothetical protein